MTRRAWVIPLVGVLLAGCGLAPRPPRALLYEAKLPGERYPSIDQPLVAGLAAGKNVRLVSAGPEVKPLRVLAVCAGGVHSAFTAGAVVGWTQSGKRPTFDVVTGTSSGALVGTYAFLGPKYDAKLEALFTATTAADLFEIQPVRGLLREGVVASPEPMRKRIQAEVNESLLADLREAHVQGRRLFIGTTNVNTRRLVVWDLGAIAASGRPEAVELVCNILLASATWPGLLPPVEFITKEDGTWRHEFHVDGGCTSQCFMRFGPTPGWPEGDRPAPGWLSGSELYVLAAGRLYDCHAKAPDRFFCRIMGAVSCMTGALARAEMHRLHALCMTSGMSFNLLAMPEQTVGAQDSLVKMQKSEMRRLFEAGRELTAKGASWRHTPPGPEPGEEEMPRGALVEHASTRPTPR